MFWSSTTPNAASQVLLQAPCNVEFDFRQARATRRERRQYEEGVVGKEIG